MRVHLKGHFCVVALGGRVLARRREGAGDAGRRAHHQHVLGRRAAWDRSARPRTRRRRAAIAALTLVQAAELGRYGDHRQRDRPVGPHPHDRDGVRRDDGGAAEGSGAFDAMAPENVSPLVRVARLAAVAGRHRARLRGRGREGVGRRRLATRRRSSTTAPAGTPPTSGPSSTSSSPTPHPPPPSTAPDPEPECWMRTGRHSARFAPEFGLPLADHGV